MLRLRSVLCLTHLSLALAAAALSQSTITLPDALPGDDLPPASASASHTDASVQETAAAIRAGHYADALDIAGRALQKSPRDKRLLTLRGIAQQRLTQDRAAIASFNQALTSDPKYLPALRGIVESEYRTHAPETAPDLDHLLALAPGDLTAHVLRAAVAWQKRDCPAVIEHSRAARSLIDTQPVALSQYAACLAHTRQDDAALEIFRRLHQLNPEDRQPLYAIAALQLDADRYRDAVSALAPYAGSHDPDVLVLLASAYGGSNDAPDALATLREAIAAAPTRTSLYLQFASLAMDHGALQDGMAVLNAGLDHSPHSPDLLLLRGVLLSQQGRYVDADRDFAEAALRNLHPSTGYGVPALAALQENRSDEALILARASAQDHPTDALSWYVAGAALATRGALPGSPEFVEALTAAETAIQNQPELLAASELLSRLYLQNHAPDDAIAECRRILSFHPNDETALYRLTRALKLRAYPQDLAEVSRLQTRLATTRHLEQTRQAEASRFRLTEPPPADPRLATRSH